MTLRERIHNQAEELQAVRDEIRVRMHLGKMDAQDLWEDLEKRWKHAEGKLKVLGDASRETVDEVAEALELAFVEMKAGYSKLRDLL